MPGPIVGRDNFVDRVAAFIDEYDLLGQGSGVLLAVSGGADSVSLLRAMVELADQAGRSYRLAVGHLDHGLRAESPADAAFVAELADRFALPLIRGKVDVASMARRDGVSEELTGRRVRYEFLQAAADQAHCLSIATAHHADDNVETVMHRIIRGTGLDGLRGIRPKRNIPGRDGGLSLIRPMLAVTRGDVEAYLGRLSQPYRTDLTNARADYTIRNRIRHELLPLLRRHYNPAVDRAVGRLASLAEWAAPALNELGDKMLASAIREQAPGRLCLAAAELLAKGPMAASQAIRSALARMAAPMGSIGMEHIRQVVDLLDADASGAAVDLPGGVRVFRQFDLLVLELGQSSGHADDAEPVPLPLGGTTQLPDSAVLSVTIRPGNQADLARFLIGKPADAEMLDADSLIEPLTARRWRDGDRFVPLGAGGSQKLSDFFCSAKVPPAGRRAAWIVCDRLGPIWVAPYRIAHRARITPATGRLALLRLQRRQGRA